MDYWVKIYLKRYFVTQRSDQEKRSYDIISDKKEKYHLH